MILPTLSFHIETSTTCNAACRFCPYITTSRERAGKLMDPDLFHKIVDEISSIPVADKIHFVGLNEPLLDSRLEEFIAYSKHVTHGVVASVYTNGLLLTEHRYRSLKTAGLDTIVVSLNAVRADQHERIMGMRGKFDAVCKNIEYAKQFDYPVLQVHAVYTGDTFTTSDRDAFYGRWGDARGTGHGLVVRTANWGGDIDVLPSAVGIVLANECCFRAISQLYITYDGTVTTCCMDPLGRQVFGNVNTQTIREIYNSAKYLEFRSDHANNRAEKYEICKGCTRV